MADGLTAAIGVISGTSMDGIDVALVLTDGNTRVEAGPGRTYDYDPALRRELLALIADPGRCEHDPLDALENAVSDAHADAVRRFMADFAIETVDLVGIHGRPFCIGRSAVSPASLGGDRGSPPGLVVMWSIGFAMPMLRRVGKGRRLPRCTIRRWRHRLRIR